MLRFPQSPSPKASFGADGEEEKANGGGGGGGGEMELFYYLVFGGLSAVVAVLELTKTSKDQVATSPAFNAFKNNYLVVYSLMMGSTLLPLLSDLSFATKVGFSLSICSSIGRSDLAFARTEGF